MKWAYVLRPVGPLAAAVYWRRRTVVVVVTIVALVLLTRACSSPGSSATARPAAKTSARPSPTVAPRPTPTPTPARPVPVTVAGDLVPITRVAWADTTVPRCAAAQLAVRIDANAAAYRAGTGPLFTMKVSASNTLPCALDLAPSVTSVRVTLSGVPVWSGGSCVTRPARRILMRPGGTTQLAVRWNRLARTSPCGRPGLPVGSGLYELLGTAGGVTSYGGTLTLR